MDVTAFVPIIVALIAGGALTLYTARPRKSSIVAEAADKAVIVVGKALDRQEEELDKARRRIVLLEDAAILLEARVHRLRDEVERLGGDVERINRIGKQGPRGEKGPRGEPGPNGH